MQQNISPTLDSEVLDSMQIESERLMLLIRLPEGIAKDSLSHDQIASLNPYLESGAINPTKWDAGSVSLTLSGRLIADRIVRELLL